MRFSAEQGGAGQRGAVAGEVEAPVLREVWGRVCVRGRRGSLVAEGSLHDKPGFKHSRCKTCVVTLREHVGSTRSAWAPNITIYAPGHASTKQGHLYMGETASTSPVPGAPSVERRP